MQPIKLIAIDLDGTLLNEKKEISEYSLCAVRWKREFTSPWPAAGAIRT